VYGPEVQSLVKRYLGQMMAEMQQLRDPANAARSLLESIELVVPHQANQTMVTKLAVAAGLAADRLYFNIGKVGNTSSASIPLALFDAVVEGVIKAPVRIFAPSFGAGAVAGYIVLRFDPAVVALKATTPPPAQPATAAPQREGSSVDDVQAAFGS
jgi:3-oxoacyl-[acyl-carrier-protein] synthase III